MSSKSAFTLVEVACAIGIAAFSLVALLALFPVGLKEGAVSALETRGSHLAQTVFATLESGRFEAAPLYGATLDLASLDETSDPVVLYATYPATGDVAIAAFSEENTGGDYRLELRFQKEPALAGGRVSGNRVSLSITAIRLPREAVRFQSVIGNF